MKQLNWYQIFGNTHNIPDGRTVLPTDDIQIWLNCANIWDKTYTTLAEVLADTDTLLALITSNNAVDYMVRSTTWATINGLVPIMTSNTTPSGVVSSNSVRPSSNYPWNAFNGIDNGGGWCPTNAGNNLYIQYKFESATLINSITVKSMNAAQQSAVWSLKASNDGVTFVELTTVNEPDPNNKVTKSFGNTTEYQYYRLEGYFTNSGGGVKVQFYSPSIVMSESAMTYIGQNNYCANTLLADATWCNAICNSEYFESVLNVKVPVMTSNITPSGECFGSSLANGTGNYYNSFDGDNTSFCLTYGANRSTSADQDKYIGYDFGTLVTVAKIEILSESATRPNTDGTLTIQYSDDNLTWSNDKTFSFVGSSSPTMQTEILNIARKGKSFRAFTQNGNGKSSAQYIWLGIRTLQFYGRKDI